MKNNHDHGHILFDYDDQKQMTLGEAIKEAEKALGQISSHPMVSKECLETLLSELKRATTKLREVLPNGGFVVKDCPNSMTPSIANSSPTYITDYFKQLSNDKTIH